MQQLGPPKGHLREGSPGRRTSLEFGCAEASSTWAPELFFIELGKVTGELGQEGVAFRCDSCCPNLGRREEARYARLRTY